MPTKGVTGDEGLRQAPGEVRRGETSGPVRVAATGRLAPAADGPPPAANATPPAPARLPPAADGSRRLRAPGAQCTHRRQPGGAAAALPAIPGPGARAAPPAGLARHR